MDVHIELAGEELFTIGPVSVTNSMITMFIVMFGLLFFGVLVARRATMVPGRLQAAVEIILEALMGMAEGAGGKSLGRKVFPLISGLFIFILFANYSGLLPGVGTIGLEKAYHSEEAAGSDGEHDDSEGASEGEAAIYTVASVGSGASSELVSPATEEGETVLVPFLRPPTADLNMTLAMALVTFTAVQLFGIQAHGVVGRLKHMADPPFLFPIEVISEFSRIISLSARLFGNVFAGEALLAVMYAIGAKVGIVIIPVFVPVVFLFLELMFGTIQAMVFAILTLIYISVAAAHSSHDEEEHAAEKSPVASAAGD